MADHQEKDHKRDYINHLVQSYFPEISSLEDSTQTVIQTIFEWSLSNFEKRLKMYCSNAPRSDEEDLRRYMQTSDIQENYLMQIFKSRQINGLFSGHTRTNISLQHNEPMQPTNLPTNPEPQQYGREPGIGTPNHTHVIQPRVNHANQLITNIPNRQVAMLFPQLSIPIELPTAAMLASVPPQDQKQLLGESLFPRIQRIHPDLAGKITGMLLEIDNTELLQMVHSNDSLKAKVDEAVAVLQAHQAKEAAAIRKE